MSTISLCMIVRDAEATLRQCLDSAAPFVDEVVIVLAGESKDNTKGIAQQYTDLVYEIPWEDDFAKARNFSFSKATGDWLFWLDADDVLEHGELLQHQVEVCELKGFGSLHLRYDYRHDDRGRVTVTQNRERLLKRDLGWVWRDRVHEYCNATVEHLVGSSDEVVVQHTSNQPARERNLRLLQLMEEEDPNYPRMLAAMGDIYVSKGEWKLAIDYLTRFYQESDLPVLLWGAAIELARCYQKLEKWDESMQWASTANIIHPEYSLGYLLLAHASWFGKKDSERALLYLDQAEVLEEAPLTLHRQPQDYTIRRWDIEHRCLADQRDWDGAMASLRKIMEYEGLGEKQGMEAVGNQWYYFFWYYLERQNCERSVAGVAALVDHLCRRGDTMRALRLLETDLPVSIRSDPRVLALYARIKEFTAHVRGDKDGYTEFYTKNHSQLLPEFAGQCMNATDYEPYRMDLILKRLKARGATRILDVGCGAGEPALFLARHGLAVTGLDINPAAIEEAQKRAEKARELGMKTPPVFKVGTIDELGPEDLGRYDAVLMLELLEHLHPQDVAYYLSSAEDLVWPWGAVFATTPGMAVGDIPGVWSEFPRDHVQEFSRQDLEKLILQSPSRRVKKPINLFKVYDPQVSVPGFASWFLEYEWAPEQPEKDLGNWAKPVVIYVGPGLEEWDASTPAEQGLGGSETWAVEVAKEFRRRGHPVAVYAMVDEVRDGVIYRHYSNWNQDAPFLGARAWLCLASRYLEVLDQRPAADRVVFVAHDVDYGDRLTEERLSNMDRYAVMSRWQYNRTLGTYTPDGYGREFDRELGDKLAVIANGIRPEYFEGEEERVPHSFIWSSSPDRGLDVLLNWWPAIRNRLPDATLDIYYGWDNVDALAPQGRPWLVDFKAKVMAMVEELADEGVTWRGRLGQRELAREFMRHHVWLYPSTNAFGEPWNETYCMTAEEARAAGCICIYPRAGALPERTGSPFGDNEQLDWADVLEYLQDIDAFDIVAEPQDTENALACTWAAAVDAIMEAVRQPVEV